MSTLYAMVAEFDTADEVLAATRAAYSRGFRRMDAFVPFPVEGLTEALGMRRTGVPLLTLLGGIAGGCTGYGMEFYSATIHYPLNVGGRPLHSWPAFVPITFELTVLFAALSAAIGMLVLNGLPRLHHPIFETPDFAQRNSSHFYLAIEAVDPHFDAQEIRKFLTGQKPRAVWEVPA
jgi:hypothetical protein